MRRVVFMKFVCALGLVSLVIASPLAAAAQAPGTSGDLQIERKQRKSVVLPKPSPAEVRADADRAIDEYAGRSPDAVVRETSPVRPSSRPDLDYDVKSGIQGERINKELFRR
jgi:hypothetical protein